LESGRRPKAREDNTEKFLYVPALVSRRSRVWGEAFKGSWGPGGTRRGIGNYKGN